MLLSSSKSDNMKPYPGEYYPGSHCCGETVCVGQEFFDGMEYTSVNSNTKLQKSVSGRVLETFM